MNVYKLAIEKGEVIDFFRGKGNYFELDRDRGGHDTSGIPYYIFGLLEKGNENNLFLQIENDLKELLKVTDFSISDLLLIFNVFWIYFNFRYEESKILIDWEMDKVLLSEIKDKIKIFRNQKIEEKKINRILQNFEDKFNFYL